MPKTSSRPLMVGLVVGLCWGVSPRAASAADKGSQQSQAEERGAAKTANGSPRPQAIARAERLAAEAYAAYGRKEYEKSARLYEQALSAASSADILYNLARVLDLGLRDRARAQEYYQRYLEHPSSARPRTEYAQLRIVELREAARAEELMGRDKARVKTTEESLSFGAGPTDRAAAESEAVTPQADEPWSTREATGAVVAGAGFVGVALGLGFGISAYSKSDTWQSQCEGNVCSSQRGVEAAREAADHGHLATISLAAGGGLLAIGAALFFLGEEEQVGTDPKSVSLEVGAPGADLFGARIHTTF